MGRDRDEPAGSVDWVGTLRRPGSYSAVPNAVLWSEVLTLAQRMTYAALVRFSGLRACQTGEWCTVGTAALSALTGISRNGIQRALKALEAQGLIAADRTSGGRGRGAANSYRLRYVIGHGGKVQDRGSLVPTKLAAKCQLSWRQVPTKLALSKAISANLVGRSDLVNRYSDGVSPAASLLATRQEGERPKDASTALEGYTVPQILDAIDSRGATCSLRYDVGGTCFLYACEPDSVEEEKVGQLSQSQERELRALLQERRTQKLQQQRDEFSRACARADTRAKQGKVTNAISHAQSSVH